MRRLNKSKLETIKSLDHHASFEFSLYPPRLKATGLPAVIAALIVAILLVWMFGPAGGG